MKPCEVKTGKQARRLKDFRLAYKDEIGDTRIIEAGFSSQVSDDDEYFYFEINEETKEELDWQVVMLRPKEIEAFIKWWNTDQ